MSRPSDDPAPERRKPESREMENRELESREPETRKPAGPLRTGFTTGACATAASAASAGALLTGVWTNPIRIALPRGETPDFALEEATLGPDFARAAVRKDAGDDPDVTHQALICATVRPGRPGSGVTFRAGEGVGRVTRPGLPLPPGEPAINPAPREMMTAAVAAVAAAAGRAADFEIEIAVPGGEALAAQTWNPRLGIEGGLSILGTTGIVRPFSCAAWIASIHRGIDVARAGGAPHAIASTGATSERVAQARWGVPDWALLDMGDFAGGLLKYLRAHPLPRLTLAGGFAKLTKLAQGALDLHSGRSQVDFAALAKTAGEIGADADAVRDCGTALEALTRVGPGWDAALALAIARRARGVARETLGDAPVAVDVLVVGRDGRVLADTAEPD